MKSFTAMRCVTRYVTTVVLLAVFVFAVSLLSTDSKFLQVHVMNRGLSFSSSDITTGLEGKESNMKSPARIFLWAVPRSVSTTFLISMSRSPNTLAWFEPFLFASNIKKSNKSQKFQKPRQKISFTLSIASRYDKEKISFEWVKAQLEGYHKEKTNIFVKDMVKGIAGKFEFIPKGYTHTFLIRHPLRVFSRYKEKHNIKSKGNNKGLKLTEYTEEGVIPPGYFFKEMYDLVHHIRDVLKHKVIIIDSEDLLEDPEKMLRTYCEEVGLTYDENMLQWDSNSNIWWDWILPQKTALAWLRKMERRGFNPFHNTTFSQSGFSDKMKLPEHVDDDVLKLANASMVYYNELYRHRIHLNSI